MTTTYLPLRAARLTATVCGLMTLVGLFAASVESATFEYDDGELWMSGEIDSNTPADLRRALDKHPDVEWIIMQHVPGSADDDASLEAGRIVRESDLRTAVPSDGLIASGGTDFFLAGVERVVERGACIGVHAWRDDEIKKPAAQLPREHPTHQLFLAHYKALHVPAAFYWYTLRVATADEMHYMPEAEIKAFSMATEFEGEGPWDLSVCDAR